MKISIGKSIETGVIVIWQENGDLALSRTFKVLLSRILYKKCIRLCLFLLIYEPKYVEELGMHRKHSTNLP